jgi:Rrf2 family protein
MRYGSRALVFLALQGSDAPVSVTDVAADQGLSAKYLEQVLAALRSAGLVRSARGAQGGYALARSPEDITLRQVYEALEGHEGLVDCTKCPEGCPRSSTCVAQEVWAEMHDVCMRFLEGRNLAELARRARELQSRSAVTYYV